MKNVLELLKTTFPDREFVKSKNYIEDGIINSFDLMKLISLLEIEYNVEIEIDELTEENFKNIHSIEELIDKVRNQTDNE